MPIPLGYLPENHIKLIIKYYIKYLGNYSSEFTRSLPFSFESSLILAKINSLFKYVNNN